MITAKKVYCFMPFAMFRAAAAGSISSELTSNIPIHCIESATTIASSTVKAISVAIGLMPLLFAMSALNPTINTFLR